MSTLDYVTAALVTVVCILTILGLSLDMRPLLARMKRAPELTHEGATEEYGTLLHEIAESLKSDARLTMEDEPPADTEIEIMLQTHSDLDEIVRSFRAGIDSTEGWFAQEIDRIFADLDGIADERWERVMTDTMQIPVIKIQDGES